jgi:hypothetical protein
MDPIDLKTLAKFCLLGDPSIQPVEGAAKASMPKGLTIDEAAHFSRSERRQKIALTGTFLRETKPTASKQVQQRKLPSNVKSALSSIANAAGLGKDQEFMVFAIEDISKPKGQAANVATALSHYLVAIGTPEAELLERKHLGVAVVAKELGGRIVDYRIYYQR